MGFDARIYLGEGDWSRSSLGLERMEALMAQLGNPERKLRAVHVAGTNGKGSTCAYLSSILQRAGMRTGLFTSPAVEAFEERIQVDGVPIGEADLGRIAGRVREAAVRVAAACGEQPTEFELMAAIGFLRFAEAACDAVVVEVGLGGRLDATNVLPAPACCAIAPVALDHVEVLGPTLAAIAAEKAAIVKPGAAVASAPQAPDALRAIEDACCRAGCPLAVVDEGALEVGPASLADGRRCFAYRGHLFETRMLGAYQPANAALAIEVARALQRSGWPLSEEAIAEGVADARWPGRFEAIPAAAGRPPVVLDGGHNPAGAAALADSLRDAFGEAACQRGFAFVMGVMADKDHRGMLEAIRPLVASLVAWAPPSERALAAPVLAEEACEVLGPQVPVEAASSPEDAIARACRAAGAGDGIVAFGSLYGIAPLRAALAGAGLAGGR